MQLPSFPNPALCLNCAPSPGSTCLLSYLSAGQGCQAQRGGREPPLGYISGGPQSTSSSGSVVLPVVIRWALLLEKEWASTDGLCCGGWEVFLSLKVLMLLSVSGTTARLSFPSPLPGSSCSFLLCCRPSTCLVLGLQLCIGGAGRGLSTPSCMDLDCLKYFASIFTDWDLLSEEVFGISDDFRF
jgi:hypothetical protein